MNDRATLRVIPLARAVDAIVGCGALLLGAALLIATVAHLRGPVGASAWDGALVERPPSVRVPDRAGSTRRSRAPAAASRLRAVRPRAAARLPRYAPARAPLPAAPHAAERIRRGSPPAQRARAVASQPLVRLPPPDARLGPSRAAPRRPAARPRRPSMPQAPLGYEAQPAMVTVVADPIVPQLEGVRMRGRAIATSAPTEQPTTPAR